MFEEIIRFEIPYDYMSVVWERRIRRASSYEIKYLDFRLGFYRSSKGWVGKVISHPFSSEGSG